MYIFNQNITTMEIKNVWKKLKSSPAILHPHIRISDDHILDPEWNSRLFKKEENYFEIRITEQFLKNHREYWNEFNPLTVIRSEFIYAGKHQSFPFIVGPEILKGLEQIQGQENVRYKNTRVSGPTPYQGDQLALFVGLFRMKTKDWARQALGLLESVTKAFDSTKLSSYLSIANPVMDGIESFLDMEDQMQFRLGYRNEFEDPETSSNNQLRSGYYLMIRNKDASIDTKNFWIKENQLFTGNHKDHLKPYTDNDYIIYEIAHLDVRNDYTTFDFHAKWKEIQDLIWKTSNKNETIEIYQHMIHLIWANSDLIDSHRKKLQLYYRAKFQQEWQTKEVAGNPLTNYEALGLDFVKKSNERLDKLHVDRSTKHAIDLSNDLLKRLNKEKGTVSIPVEIQEKDIIESLQSDILDKKSIESVNINSISSVLGSEMPLL